MKTTSKETLPKFFIVILIAGIAIFPLSFLLPLPSQVSASEYDPCPPGNGPNGITAGDYDPTKLSQEQRQWLFEVFGHAGIAPVGYGGERCGVAQQGQSIYDPCPSGTGPDGITAGDYDPNTLSQEKKQWLFEIFGNIGIAPVGYGGQQCGVTPPSPTFTPTLSETPTPTSTPTPLPITNPMPSLAYWKMEEGSGTMVVDSSGNGYDQSFANAPASPSWSTDVPTLSEGNNQSLAFDGNDDYSYSWNVTEMASSSQLTVETWVKFDGIPGSGTILSAAQSSTTQWLLGTSGREIRVVIFDNPAWGCCYDPPGGMTVGVNLQPNQWYHIAFVYDTNEPNIFDKLKVYVDGTRYPLTMIGILPATLENVNPEIQLGTSSNTNAAGTPLHGKLDETRIYTFALNSADIAINASGQSNPTKTDTLIAFWKMEEGIGSQVVDSSGNGHDVTLVGAPASPLWSSDVPSQVVGNGYSLDFDGIDDFAYTWNIPEMTGATELTVETWVKFDGSIGTFQTLASAFQWSLQTQWLFETTNTNELRVYLANYPADGFCCDGNSITYGETVGANLKAGQWYHMAFVYDGKGGTNEDKLKIYVDGETYPLIFHLDVPTALQMAYPVVRLGGEGRFYYQPHGPLNGKLDEFRIYASARRKADIYNDWLGQVAAVQAPPPPTPTPTPGPLVNPVAYWRMERVEDNKIIDSTGNGHDQNLTGPQTAPLIYPDAPAQVNGDYSSLAFDGADDFTYANPIPDMVGATQLTVETWVKFNENMAKYQTVASAFQWGVQTQWLFETAGTNELRVYLANYHADGFCCDGNTITYGETVGANLQAGQWYHVAFVFNGDAATDNDRLKIYVNGEQRPVLFHLSVPTALQNDTPNVRLGLEDKFYYQPHGPLAGKLDEFRIYTVARSGADIALDARGETPVIPQPPPYIVVIPHAAQDGNRVIAYGWPFDETITMEIDDPETPQNPDFSTQKVVDGYDPYDSSTTLVLFNLQGDPYKIQSGDLVSISDGSIIKTLTVSSLAFTKMSFTHDTVSGIANPNTRVDVWACDNDQCANRHAEGNGNGDWMVDFSQVGTEGNEQTTIDLIGGTWVNSGEFDNDSDRTMFGKSVPNPNIDVRANNNQVLTYNWSLGDTLTIEIDDPDTTAINPDYSTQQLVAGYTSWDPNLTYVEFNLQGVYDIQPGDVISLTDDINTKSIVVSPLAFTDISFTNNTVSGIANPDTRVNIWACDRLGSCANRHAGADNSGNWGVNFSQIGTEENEKTTLDLAVVTWIDSSENYGTTGDSTFFGKNMPDFSVRATWDQVEAYNWQLGDTLALEIDDPTNGVGIDYTGQATVQLSSWDPNTTYAFFNLQGGVYDIQAGDLVSLNDGTNKKTLTVSPLVFTDMNVANESISGVASSNARVDIWACDNSGNCANRHVTTNTSGNWIADFNHVGTEGDEQTTLDLARGMWVDSQEYYGASSDRTMFGQNIPNPHIEANPKGHAIQAREWPVGTVLTLTIDDLNTPAPVDYSNTATMGQASWNPGDPNDIVAEFAWPDSLGLQPGYVLTVTDGSVSRILVIPSLQVTHFDPDNERVSGTATQNATVRVWACGTNRCISRQVSSGNGTWTVDYSIPGIPPGDPDTLDIQPGSSGWVNEYDADGDLIWQDWRVPNPRIEAAPYSDWIHANEWPIGTQITMTVDDPSNGFGTDYSESSTVVQAPWSPGDPTDTAALFGWPDEFTPGPGFTITMSGDDGQSETYTVINLKVTSYDLVNDTVSGIATPNAEVQICVFTSDPQDNCAWRYVTVDGAGNWTADYNHAGSRGDEQKIMDIQAGTGGWTAEYDTDGDRTWFDWNVPIPTGTISGTVKDLNGNPITGYTIGVTVTTENNDALSSTCTDPATGQYTVTDVPQNIPAKIVAGETQCGSHPYGIEFWQHATNNLPPELITLTESAPDMTGIDFNLGSFVSSMEFFVFNFDNPIVTDPAVRQAIAFGTDREGILNEAFLPNGEFGGIVQNTYIPMEHWAKAPNPALSLYPYDPVQARAILSAAGWIDTNGDGIREKNGQRLTLNFKTTLRPSRVASGDIFQQNMADIGIEIITEYIDAGTFFGVNGTVEAGDFDIAEYTSGSCASAEDETCLADAMFLGGDPSNTGHYNNALADLEFHAIQTATTRADKLTHSIQHQAIISQDLAVFPLFTRGQDVEPVDTPIGDDVSISPTTWLTIQFDQVDQPGVASAVETYFTPEDLPGGFQLIGTVYEIGTTAQFTQAQVCFNYDDSSLSSEEESHLKLYHQENLEWVNVTDVDYPNTSANLICGTVDSFSPFAILLPLNQAPIANAGPDRLANEGDTLTLDASASSDPEGSAMTYAWDLDNDSQYDDATGVTAQHIFSDNGTFTVGLRVTDSGGLSATDMVTVTVANVSPTISSITAPVSPVQLGTMVNVSAAFTDPGTEDTFTAVWTWDDGTTSSGVVTNHRVTGSHQYTLPGVNNVRLTVTDDNGGAVTLTFQYVVVYDPTGGFVTGGGWFIDPATGSKAHFGFNPKYQKNTTIPKGETEFKLSGITFKSTSHDWLVINSTKAQFKGSGTINGAGEYGFLVTVIDGTPDKIRIKIWDKATGEEFYDNQPGAADNADPTTPIGGGSIQVHAK
jgi:hypothetical protein